MKKQIILTEKNFNKLKEQVKKNSENEIIFSSNDDELNRKVLEKLKIQILLINQENRKDFQKQRNSGLNQVLTKIAKKNNIQIGINFDEIVEAHPRAYTKEVREPQRGARTFSRPLRGPETFFKKNVYWGQK